jgi:TolB-like protein/Tfp pilus assembly protein PilF
MDPKKFFSELKRRNVYKVAIAYSITAWLLAQMAGLGASSFEAPIWVMKIIIIVLMIGFPIALILAWAFEMSPQGIKKTTSIESKNRPSSVQKNRSLIIYLFVGILFIALTGQFFYYKFWDNNDLYSSDIEKSIAVLPFKNDSPNKENLYFCNGIMAGILDHLRKIPDLTVISRTSVEKYREDPPSITEIAKELNVNYILEGSVLRFEDRVQITTTLIYTPTNKHLWSDQFDKDIKNVETIFFVLSDVAQNIAGELRAKISPEIQERIKSIPTSDLTAFDYYLQGNEFYYSWWNTRHESDLENADRLYMTALNRDSTFAPSYVGRANIYRIQNINKSYLKENFLDSVRIYCDKAIKLDPSLAEAYFCRGEYYKSINNIKKAESDLKKSVELKPNYDQAYGRLSTLYYENIGNYIDALKFLNRAMKTAKIPYNRSQGYKHYANIYMNIGDWKKSLLNFQKEKELNPWANNIYLNYMVQGKFQTALEVIENNPKKDINSLDYLSQLGLINLMLEKNDLAVQYYKNWEEKIKNENSNDYKEISNWIRYGLALTRIGKTEAGITMMKNQLQKNEKIINLGRGNYSPFYDIAGIYSFLGDTEKAIKYLREWDKRSFWKLGTVYLIQVDPLFENIRNNLEYKKIINDRLTKNSNIRDEINRLKAEEDS